MGMYRQQGRGLELESAGKESNLNRVGVTKAQCKALEVFLFWLKKVACWQQGSGGGRPEGRVQRWQLLRKQGQVHRGQAQER